MGGILRPSKSFSESHICPIRDPMCPFHCLPSLPNQKLPTPVFCRVTTIGDVVSHRHDRAAVSWEILISPERLCLFVLIDSVQRRCTATDGFSLLLLLLLLLMLLLL